MHFSRRCVGYLYSNSEWFDCIEHPRTFLNNKRENKVYSPVVKLHKPTHSATTREDSNLTLKIQHLPLSQLVPTAASSTTLPSAYSHLFYRFPNCPPPPLLPHSQVPTAAYRSPNCKLLPRVSGGLQVSGCEVFKNWIISLLALQPFCMSSERFDRF